MAIKLKPPKKNMNSLNNEQKVSESKKSFIEESAHHKPIGKILGEKSHSQAEYYPWEAPTVRRDIKKTFNIRLSEVDWLKLKYLSDKTGESMQEIILDAFIPIMYKKLKKLIDEDNNQVLE